MRKLLYRLRALWAAEPVRCTTAIVVVVVFLAAKLGIVLDEQNVGQAVVLIVPLLIGGEAARAQVTPTDQPPG